MRRNYDRLDTAMDALDIILEAHKEQMKSVLALDAERDKKYGECLDLLEIVLRANPQYRPDTTTAARIAKYVDLENET